VVAVLIAVRLARWLVRDDRPWRYMIAVCLSGLVTARVGHVVDNWPSYEGDLLRAMAFTGGGIAVTAAPIGSTIAGVLMARRLRLPVGFMLDVATIGIAVGLAVGRIGDIINGEHHAIACAGLPWCVRYTHPETLGQATYVHPVVVYDALFDLAIAAAAYAYWRRAVRGRPPEGRAWLLVLAAYGIGRFVTSFLRLDPVLVAGLQEAQLLGLAYGLLGVPLLFVLERRARRGR
jgi:phosphatidylglycerol:prolipoprotein diacylglycerol transferase